MRHLLAALVLALPLYLPWTSRGDAFDRETLETALILAGLDGTNLPITLARVAPASASAGVEAWIKSLFVLLEIRFLRQSVARPRTRGDDPSRVHHSMGCQLDARSSGGKGIANVCPHPRTDRLW